MVSFQAGEACLLHEPEWRCTRQAGYVLAESLAYAGTKAIAGDGRSMRPVVTELRG